MTRASSLGHNYSAWEYTGGELKKYHELRIEY